MKNEAEGMKNDLNWKLILKSDFHFTVSLRK